jgi:nucleotide-binding universal stress UspA family protein
MDIPIFQPKNDWKILIAIDGSEHSKAALDLLSSLPLPSATDITVLGVFLPRNASDFYAFQPILQQAEAQLRHMGVQAHAELLAGQPSEIIHQMADEQHPHLIVLGARGRRATAGIRLGGVAQQVVEYSNSPVLVVRAPFEGLERILLVVDGSLASQCSVEYMGRLPLPETTHIEVVHILPPVPLPQPLISAPVWSIGYERGALIDMQTEEELQALYAEERKNGQALLERTSEHLVKLLQGRGSQIPVSTLLLQGDASTEIIEHATEQHTDLIVAGSRGLSAVKGWLLGSVSRKLLHYAPCSVLVVRCLPH